MPPPLSPHLIRILDPPTMLPRISVIRMRGVLSVGDSISPDTPHYAIVTEVAHRIHKLYGESSYDGSFKYFISLREPVARAISSWEYKFDCEWRHLEQEVHFITRPVLGSIRGSFRALFVCRWGFAPEFQIANQCPLNEETSFQACCRGTSVG